MSEDLIPGELLSRLASMGRVYLLDTVGSTNEYAFTLAERKEPAIVIARRQTKGRGRFRRHWFADDDSLIFSVLFFPSAGFTSPASVTQIAGLALGKAIEDVVGTNEPRALLRWPNDVMIKGKKVAGILCEKRKDALVVGVGVNVNQEKLPESLPEAGSLFLVYGKKVERFSILDLFLPEFFTTLERMIKGEGQRSWDEIKNRSAVLHHRVEIRTLLRKFVGTVIDIDEEGRIVLRGDSGKIAVFSVGQVKQLR